MAREEHRDGAATPLATKLGIRQGSRVLVTGAPQGFSLDPLPDEVEIVAAARGSLDVALLFTTRQAVLRRRFATIAGALVPAGRLWVAWPKKASAIDTDLTFGVVQRHGLDAGLVDNKSASIDADFQGLQFVVRLKDRLKDRPRA